MTDVQERILESVKKVLAPLFTTTGLAEIFSELDVVEQAEFLREVDRLSSGWPEAGQTFQAHRVGRYLRDTGGGGTGFVQSVVDAFGEMP